MREALYYEPLPDGRVHCTLCPHDCRIHDGVKGACGVRINHNGELFTLVDDRVAARDVDPVEKKPLFHFHPGSTCYSIATVGCTLRCRYCQNSSISQWPATGLPRQMEWRGGDDGSAAVCPELLALADRIPGEPITPASLVRAAKNAGAESIACTYTEPTVFYELALDLARTARAAGLKTIFVTNGYTCEEPLRRIAPLIDAVNIDLKFFREESYRRISRASMAPVLDAIRLYHDLGVWVEVTTLVVPELNDSDEELRWIAQFLRAVGPEIPWHLSAFRPSWRMSDWHATSPTTLRHARQIGLAAGLRYVYEGNIPGRGAENTWCPNCRSLLIERFGCVLLASHLVDGACRKCGFKLDGVGL